MAKIHKDSTKKEPDQPNAIITEVEDDEIEEFVPMTRCQILTVQKTLIFTVWKFHDFSITQIFPEINGDSRHAKSAILTLLEGLNFDFLWISTVLEG